MALSEQDLMQIRQRINSAYAAEAQALGGLRQHAAKLTGMVKRIRPYSVNAVSFMSSDGGDNRIDFNPGIIELVRVVDSRGQQCALDAIGGNTPAKDLDSRISAAGASSRTQPLKRLCDDLRLRVTQLSGLLGGLGREGRSTNAIRAYRDIVEWAVLYDLLCGDWTGDTIFVRDGLLRTNSFREDVFPKVDQAIRDACARYNAKDVNITMVGVAKRSAVLSKLAIALELEETFHKPFPCYVEVPRDIEEDCWKYDRGWLDTLETSVPNADGAYSYQSMGRLHLVKFGDRPFDPVWPVDVAAWDVANVERIMGQLLHDARLGFPIPDFPHCVQKAHDYAKIGGIEMAVLQDMLTDGLLENMSKAEQEKILRIRHLREDLIGRRYANA